jgi:propanol-preferring alcohol dehydrogenase
MPEGLTVTGVAVGTEDQMLELLQHASDKILPKVTVVGFDQVGTVLEGLKRQDVTGRVVVKIS